MKWAGVWELAWWVYPVAILEAQQGWKGRRDGDSCLFLYRLFQRHRWQRHHYRRCSHRRMTAVGLRAGPGCCLPQFGSQARQSCLRPLALWDALQALLQHANALGIVINRFNQPKPGRFVAWIGFYQRKQDLTGLLLLALMDVRDGLDDFFDGLSIHFI